MFLLLTYHTNFRYFIPIMHILMITLISIPLLINVYSETDKKFIQEIISAIDCNIVHDEV